MRLLLFLMVLTGCATQPATKPAPSGHSTDQHGKMMFYKAPEELWPEDFKPTPQVCGSPFQGKLISR